MAGPYAGRSNQEVARSNVRAAASVKGFGGFTFHLAELYL